MLKNIQIDQATADGLQAQAQAFGISLQEYLRMIATNGSRLNPPATALPFEEWSAQLHRWASSFPSVSRPADDDRESLYAGQGE